MVYLPFQDRIKSIHWWRFHYRTQTNLATSNRRSKGKPATCYPRKTTTNVFIQLRRSAADGTNIRKSIDGAIRDSNPGPQETQTTHTGDNEFPELLFWVVVEVVVEEEEGRQRLPVVGRPLVEASRAFVAVHVHLAAKMVWIFKNIETETSQS